MADVDVRDKVKVLDPLVVRCSLNFVILPPIPYRSVRVNFSLHLLTHLWLHDGLVAKDQDHISFLLE